MPRGRFADAMRLTDILRLLGMTDRRAINREDNREIY